MATKHAFPLDSVCFAPMDLFQENVIVTGHWNIPLLSQVWLADHDIVLREEFLPGQSIFTPAMIQVGTLEFGLFAIEDRIQFAPTCEDAKGRLIAEHWGCLVELLPQTPYTGVGLNFIWHYRPSGTATISSTGRRLFFKRTHFSQESSIPRMRSSAAIMAKTFLAFDSSSLRSR